MRIKHIDRPEPVACRPTSPRQQLKACGCIGGRGRSVRGRPELVMQAGSRPRRSGHINGPLPPGWLGHVLPFSAGSAALRHVFHHASQLLLG
jgi:hypothetical protein